MIQTVGQVIGNIMLEDRDFPIRLQMKEAPQVLLALLRRVIHNMQWLNGYDGVADWITDTKGRGLLLIGGCGVGKTVIATKLVPYIVKRLTGKICHIYKARELSDTQRLREIVKYPLKVIDDIGTETETNEYGIRRYALSEVIDIAEENDHFVVLTTNLSIQMLKERYGERTFDRLRSMCKIVVINSESKRQ